MPRTVGRKATRQFQVLREDPTGHSNAKRLTGYKDLWRLRLGDHRLVYHHDASKKEVVLLMIGKRSEIYDRLHIALRRRPGHGDRLDRPELLEPEPTPDPPSARP